MTATMLQRVGSTEKEKTDRKKTRSVLKIYAFFFLLNRLAGSWARTIATNITIQPQSSLTDIFWSISTHANMTANTDSRQSSSDATVGSESR